ncbi:hypothetical protein [Francisella persica]|uniref:hypothetical protein n=1 Tax=Francisella persica TaxID=954 RepID=UPI000AF96D50
MTGFVNPNEIDEDLVQRLIHLTWCGANYSFECIGNIKVMRQALEYKCWGVSVIIIVTDVGEEIST